MFFSLATAIFSLSITGYNYQTGVTTVYKQIDNLQVSNISDYCDDNNINNPLAMFDSNSDNNSGMYVFPELCYTNLAFDNGFAYDESYEFSVEIFMEVQVTNEGGTTWNTKLPMMAIHFNPTQNVDTGLWDIQLVDSWEYEGVGVGYNYIPYFSNFNVRGSIRTSPSSPVPLPQDLLVSNLGWYNYQALTSSVCEKTWDNAAQLDLDNYEYILRSTHFDFVGFTYLSEYADINNDEENTAFNNGYNSGYENGYNSGNESGNKDGYAKGYAEGYEIGSQGGIATEIFANIFQVGMLPVNVFLQLFDMTVWGVNIRDIVTSLLTIGMIIIILRTIFGGKNGDE